MSQDTSALSAGLWVKSDNPCIQPNSPELITAFHSSASGEPWEIWWGSGRHQVIDDTLKNVPLWTVVGP